MDAVVWLVLSQAWFELLVARPARSSFVLLVARPARALSSLLTQHPGVAQTSFGLPAPRACACCDAAQMVHCDDATG